MTLKLTDDKDVPALLRGASSKPEITSLSFRRVKFDQNEAAALFTLMKINRKWVHVLFEDCGGQLDFPIATFMFNDNVKKMSFLKQFSPTTSLALNAALHFTQCLETVRIEAALTKENMEPLSTVLANNICNIKELDLRSCEMDDNAVKLLATGLRSNKKLRSLSIKNCKLADNQVRDLVAALAENQSLEELDLGYNQCSTQALVWVKHILESKTCKLDRLSLENQDQPLDIKPIATALQTNRNLEYLDLSGNQLGNDDLVQLATVLKSNTTLQTLHLWDNKLTDNGAIAFAAVIPSFEGLKRLYLGENQFGKEGVKHMLQALETNDALQYVALPTFSWVREMAV